MRFCNKVTLYFQCKIKMPGLMDNCYQVNRCPNFRLKSEKYHSIIISWAKFSRSKYGNEMSTIFRPTNIFTIDSTSAYFPVQNKPTTKHKTIIINNEWGFLERTMELELISDWLIERSFLVHSQVETYSKNIICEWSGESGPDGEENLIFFLSWWFWTCGLLTSF